MITIVNPPNPPATVSNKDMMGGLGQLYETSSDAKIPSIDIPYAAALLRQKGHGVQVIDCLASGWEISELLVQLQTNPPEIVALRTSTPTFEWDMRVVQLIKSVIQTQIVVFGPHVALSPQETLKRPCVDAIVLSEPEYPLLEMAENHGFVGCAGVWYKQGSEVIQNPPRSLIEDLDELPFPAWDLLPYQGYDGTALMRHLKPFVTIQTSRGCPHSCTYCPYPVTQGRRLRARSPQNVVDELEWLEKDLGVRAVMFRDPEFALDRDRVVGICEAMIQRGLSLVWRCETRLKDLDEDLIALMAKAGCIGINMGIESADDQVLRQVKRRAIPFEQAKKVIDACQTYGIESFCFFILGLPGEDRQSALQTIAYALRLNPTYAQFTASTPYPGTELRRWSEANNYLEDGSLSALTSYQSVSRNQDMTVEDIQQLRQFAQESIEMRHQLVLRRLQKKIRPVAGEVKRWFMFQQKKLQMQTMPKS